jgi:hypothetical protein
MPRFDHNCRIDASGHGHEEAEGACGEVVAQAATRRAVSGAARTFLDLCTTDLPRVWALQRMLVEVRLPCPGARAGPSLQVNGYTQRLENSSTLGRKRPHLSRRGRDAPRRPGRGPTRALQCDHDLKVAGTKIGPRLRAIQSVTHA